MSASEKLKALEGRISPVNRFKSIDEWLLLTDALPQIVAVVEAAEPFREVHPYGFKPEDIKALDAALSALDEALS